jgi:large subunit ribosomal protein L25
MAKLKTIIAEPRGDVGKGASRRLRREGKIPAVIYGGKQDALSLTLDHGAVLHESEHEAFYASILDLQLGKEKQQVILRDLQRHPYRPIIMHIDFQRVSAEQLIRIEVPIHFVGAEKSPAAKATGVVIQHQLTEVEIAALPKDLPEYITVDLSSMDDGDIVMLSDLQLPEGVTIPALKVSEDNDTPVASTSHIKESQGTGAAAAAEAEAAVDELGELEEGEEGAQDEGEEGAKGEDERASRDQDED